jgi:hypothetical protein
MFIQQSPEEALTQIFWYMLLAVILIGVLANLIAFLVCSSSSLRNTVFSVYFRFIATIDTLTLLFNSFLQKFLAAMFEIKIYNMSNDYCRLNKIISYALTSTSSWILVAISVDRYLRIAFPIRFLFRKKRSLQLFVCILLLLKDLIFYSQLYMSFVQTTYSYDNTTNQSLEEITRCEVINANVLYWLDLFNSALIPGLLMLICTVMILKCLHDSKKINITSNGNEKSISYSISNRQQKFAFTACILNLIFFVTNFPITVYDLYTDYYYVDATLKKMLFSFFFLIYYVNFGSVFFINFTVNSNFRKAFFSFCQNSGIQEESKHSSSSSSESKPS